jgi:cutinase
LLGGSSTSGGLSALESLIPSSGLGGLGFKARRDASEIEKRQFSLSK